MDEKAQALDEYIEAQEHLEQQQKLFTDRITIMFEYQNKSTLEVLLESDSLAGFFTNMEVISLIADADAQAVDMLQAALDDAELQADLKLQHAEEMQGIADEKKRQLDELEKLIGQTEATIDDVNTKRFFQSLEKWMGGGREAFCARRGPPFSRLSHGSAGMPRPTDETNHSQAGNLRRD